MALIKVTKIISCKDLNDKKCPIGITNNFSQVDENIIIWVKLVNIKKPSILTMEWINPEGISVFTVDIDVKSTDSDRPFRYAWSVMNRNFLSFFNFQKSGKWTIKLEPTGNRYHINIKELKSYNKMDKRVPVGMSNQQALFDIKI